MTVTVDGKTWSGKTALVRYSNGIEAMFSAQGDLIEALKVSKLARVKVFATSPIFEFPLQGAKMAIESARFNCR